MTSTPPLDPWRDELTPRSRASRRRWTVVLAVLLVGMGLTATSDAVARATTKANDGMGGVLYLVAILVVFGLLRRGTGRLGRRSGTDDRALDERDVAARHRAFRTAFVLFLLVVAVTVVALPEILPSVPVGTGDDPSSDAARLTSDNAWTVLMWLVAWAAFLPTAALAWREPDAPDLDPEDAPPLLGELTRDALLVLTLGGGAALGAVLPGDSGLPALAAGLVPFLTLALVVGVIRSRRAGHSALRAVRMPWFVAAAVVLMLLAAGVFAVGGGGMEGSVGPAVTTRSSEVAAQADEVVRRSGPDGRRRRCVLVRAGDGRTMHGAEARTWLVRMGEDPDRLCPPD